MKWSRLAEFFQQENGGFDAVHFAYMATVVVFLGLLTFLVISNKVFPEVPGTLLAAISTIVVSKLVQRPMENKGLQLELDALKGTSNPSI